MFRVYAVNYDIIQVLFSIQLGNDVYIEAVSLMMGVASLPASGPHPRT